MYEDYIHYITKGHFDRSSKKIVEYLTMFYCDKTAKELIVPSRKTYNLFKEKYHVEKEVRIIPTGIEVDRFFKENFKDSDILKLKKELGITNEDFVILTVGRLASEKNVELLLESMKEISKKDKNIKLVIVGSGPDYENFLSWTIENKLEKNIIFTNAIPWKEIPAYYQIADVFATASKTETQGLTVLEAMSASKPVICILDDAFLDVVIDDLNGKIFNNKKEFIDIIFNLKNNPKKLESMSRQARYTSESHSLKHYALSILEVYNSCLKKDEVKKTWIQRMKDKYKKKKNN
jgi:1,2-diacylglycerol 3-alpha-glucosyltransferase